MAQPYDINMPNLLNYYNVGVDRARTNVKYAQEQEALRKEAEKNAFVAAAYRRNYDPSTKSVNTNALIGDLITGGYGMDAPAYTQTFQELEKGRIANFAEELKNQKGLLAGVADQASWDAWSANARTRLGPEISKFIPEQITPEVRRNLILKGTEQYQQGYITANTGDRFRVLATQTYAPGKATEVYNAPIGVSQEELLRAMSGAGRGQTLQKGGPVQLEDGSVVNTIFDPVSGSFFYETEQGRQRVPATARPATASFGAPLTGQQLITRRTELADEISGVKALDKYFTTVESIDQGFGFIADKLVANAKTLFDTELSPQQLATLDSRAQLQRLLGLLRESVVGPGVMTEYDAQRVIQALGGDFNRLRNKELVKKIVKDLIESKRRRAQTMQRELVDSERVFGLSPIEIPELESEAGDASNVDDLLEKYK